MRISKKLSKVGVVYRITNLVNGRRYIGLTRQLRLCERWSQHCQAADSGKTGLLANAIRKHGRDAFLMEPVASPINAESLGALEALLIEQESAHYTRGGYNLTLGGEREYSRRLSKAGRQSLIIASRNPLVRQSISAGQIARTQKDGWAEHHALMVDRARQAKDKLSESRKAYASTLFGAAQIREASLLGNQASREKFSKPVYVDGVMYPSVRAAAEAHNIERGAVRYRIKSPGFPGWSLTPE